MGWAGLDVGFVVDYVVLLAWVCCLFTSLLSICLGFEVIVWFGTQYCGIGLAISYFGFITIDFAC